MIERIMSYVSSEEIVELLIGFAPKVVAAVLVLAVVYVFNSLSKRALHRVLSRTELDKNIIRLLVDKVYSSLVLTIGIVMAVSQLGVDLRL